MGDPSNQAKSIFLAAIEARLLGRRRGKRRDLPVRRKPRRHERSERGVARKDAPDTTGSGGAQSLHAKLCVVDETRVFVGSFNFDQRSALLNTELGLVIDSAAVAGQVAVAFVAVVPDIAWKVRLAPNGTNLEWVEHGATGEVVHVQVPGASAWRLLGAGLLQLLPIEWLL